MGSTINQRFNEAFKTLGITSNKLANILGMNSRTIYNYTETDREPSFQCVTLFCQQYKQFSFDYIMYGNGELFNPAPQVIEPVDSDPLNSSSLMGLLKDAIGSLKEQLNNANERCSTLEEQNKTLLGIIKEQNNLLLQLMKDKG